MHTLSSHHILLFPIIPLSRGKADSPPIQRSTLKPLHSITVLTHLVAEIIGNSYMRQDPR
jgi:hypothetical protein